MVGLDELGRRVKSGVVRLQGIDVGDQVQVEVISRLLEGRKTIAELTSLIYGVGRQEEGFHSCYSRVRRAIKKLESKGLVSTRLFGKEKPYRLTDLAIANLVRLGGEKEQLGVVPRHDLAIYLATVTMAIPVIFLSAGWMVLSDLGVGVVFACFFYLLGASSIRLVQTLGRVF
jgi:hypothetical protein